MTPWWLALVGGVLIGIASSALLLLNGRIAGISGILHGLITAARFDRSWRIGFLLGLMVAGGIAMHLVTAGVPPRANFPTGQLVLAGLLVGFGTRMGGGCTSGHGVCGLARLSVRSIAAVITFMLTAIGTVYLMRHVMGFA